MGRRGNQHQDSTDIAVGQWVGTAQGHSGEVLELEQWGGGCGVVVFRCEQTGRQMRCGLDSCYWVASPAQIAEAMRQKAIERGGQPVERQPKREYVREPVRDARSRKPSRVGYT